MVPIFAWAKTTRMYLRKCKKKLSADRCFETFSELAKGDRKTPINDKSNTEKPLEELLGSVYWSALNKEL